MKRRDLIKAIAGAALAWPPIAHAQQSTGARYIRALTEIKHDYGKISHPSESARSDPRRVTTILAHSTQVPSALDATALVRPQRRTSP